MIDQLILTIKRFTFACFGKKSYVNLIKKKYRSRLLLSLNYLSKIYIFLVIIIVFSILLMSGFIWFQHKVHTYTPFTRSELFDTTHNAQVLDIFRLKKGKKNTVKRLKIVAWIWNFEHLYWNKFLFVLLIKN